MKKKIENQFIVNYILMFIISTMVAVFAFLLLDFADDIVSKNLVHHKIEAQSLMENDYNKIDTSLVLESGGGVQVIDENYEVVLTSGLDTISKKKLTGAEFTEFLMQSRSTKRLYSYSIAYNAEQKFWLVVSFPTSVRIEFDIIHNKEYASADTEGVVGVIAAIIVFYLIMLAICTILYSKLSSIAIVTPLKKLRDVARKLQDGDYSVRVDQNLHNEFGELQETFNAMAQQIETETLLRKQSEENRKRLILDISHDLKNPLASCMGYAELLRDKEDLSEAERLAYAKVIYDNSVRANHLIMDLFELSKMESSDYKITRTTVDACEYLRKEIGLFIPAFEEAGFSYQFNIPEKEIPIDIDVNQMNRVFENLTANAIKYNPKGTKVEISLEEGDESILIVFKDNGIGISKEIAKNIFLPFVRVDSARNSRTGGTGLGLAIVRQIVLAHEGSISLKTEEQQGCEFRITIPKI